MPERKYASDHVEGGYVDRTIFLSTAEVGVEIAEDADRIVQILTDGDPSNDHQAISIASHLGTTGSHISHTHWTAADGDRSGAKRLAQKMVESARQS